MRTLTEIGRPAAIVGATLMSLLVGLAQPARAEYLAAQPRTTVPGRSECWFAPEHQCTPATEEEDCPPLVSEDETCPEFARKAILLSLTGVVIRYGPPPVQPSTPSTPVYWWEWTPTGSSPPPPPPLPPPPQTPPPVTPVPEPTTLLSALLGLGLTAGYCWKRRRSGLVLELV